WGEARMSLPRVGTLLVAGLAVSLALLSPGAGEAYDKKKDETKKKEDPAVKWRKDGVWMSASDPTIPVDLKYQGEYLSSPGDKEKIGVQVIALDKGHFQAVVYPGGLPGAGWNGKDRSLMDGKLADDKVTFEPAKKGKGRSYKGRKP